MVDEPTSFGEDSCGRVYVTSARGGVYRLVGAGPTACPGAGGGAARNVVPIKKKKKGKGPRLRLSAAPLGAGGAPRFRIIARLSPCAGNAGRTVRLKRGGRRLAARRLNRHCTARFRARVVRRATFRAVLTAGGGGSRIRSSRLVVKASHR